MQLSAEVQRFMRNSPAFLKECRVHKEGAVCTSLVCKRLVRKGHVTRLVAVCACVGYVCNDLPTRSEMIIKNGKKKIGCTLS